MILHGDCRCVMKDLESQGLQVDAIITDPPYNISKDNNFSTMGRRGIDFGEWDKGFNQLSWIVQAYKLLKAGGTLFIFNDWKNIGHIARYAESVGFDIKDMVRWEKTNPMPRNRDRRYITDFEVAVWVVKSGGKWVFHRQSETYDRCKYVYPIVPKSERCGHPTQKPLKLIQEIIERHTDSGSLVLDPFAGSGTTGLAAFNTGRRFILIEKEEEYIKIIKSRLAVLEQSQE